MKHKGLFFVVLMALLLCLGCGVSAAGDTPALVVSGEAINYHSDGKINTYGGHTFWLTESQIESICANHDSTDILGVNIWRDDAIFSSCEDHGVPTWYYHYVDGIVIDELLNLVGVTDKELKDIATLSIYAADGYAASAASYGTTTRYYYDSCELPADDPSRIPVDAMLAYYRYIQPDNPEGLTNHEKTEVTGFPQPIFVYGQIDPAESNNCLYSKYTTRVSTGNDATFSVKVTGGQRDRTYYYTAADIVALNAQERTYTVDGKTYTVYGTDLTDFLDSARYEDQYEISFTAGDQSLSQTIYTNGLAAGDYMIAYYSTDSQGQAVANDSEIMIYGDNMALSGVTRLTCTPSDYQPGTPSKPDTEYSGKDASSYFTDMKNAYKWAGTAVGYLYEHQVVNGTGGDLYSPGESIKRGDFMLMLVRAYDLQAPFTENFSDVPAGKYYYKAIGIAKALGIAAGTGNGFEPESSLSRQDAVVLLCRTLEGTGQELTAATDLHAFSDADSVASYAQAAMKQAVAAGLINGDNGRLKPKDKLTRAEMGVILYRALTKNNTLASDLNQQAAHRYYLGSSDGVKQQYAKGDYLYDTLTVSGTGIGKEQIYSVADLEKLAFDTTAHIGYENVYSLQTSGKKFFQTTFTGIKLYDFLLWCGMDKNLPDTTTVQMIAADGYRKVMTLGQLRSSEYNRYSSAAASEPEETGLPVMLSFGGNGLPLIGPVAGDEVSRVFTEADGLATDGSNTGGPLRLTVGQTAAAEFNAPNNSKWVHEIIVGDAGSGTHSGSTEQALTVNVYDNSNNSLLKTVSYTLAELETLADTSSFSLARNYYGNDGDFYEGVQLWYLLSQNVALPGYEGHAIWSSHGSSIAETDLEYLRNLSNNFSGYIASVNGLEVTWLKPSLVFAKNGAATGRLLAALPADGQYLKKSVLNACDTLDLYVDIPTDTHSGALAESTVTLDGEGLTAATVTVAELEQQLDVTVTREYEVDGVKALYRGISVYDYLCGLGLAADADRVLLHNGTNEISFSLDDLRDTETPLLLAYSQDGTALGKSQGGPLLAVADGYSLTNVTGMTVSLKAGQWTHEGNEYAAYQTSTLRIHGNEAKGDVTLTVAQLEQMADMTVRDSYAARDGKNTYQGLILRELILANLKDGLTEPTAITVVSADGYRCSLVVTDVMSGTESYYQPGESRDIILAYSKDGVPLVPNKDSDGFVAENGDGPLKLIVENTISAWAKCVREIIIGA